MNIKKLSLITFSVVLLCSGQKNFSMEAHIGQMFGGDAADAELVRRGQMTKDEYYRRATMYRGTVTAIRQDEGGVYRIDVDLGRRGSKMCYLHGVNRDQIQQGSSVGIKISPNDPSQGRIVMVFRRRR